MLREKAPFDVCSNDKRLRCVAAALAGGREGRLFRDKTLFVECKQTIAHEVLRVPCAGGVAPYDECLFEGFLGDMKVDE